MKQPESLSDVLARAAHELGLNGRALAIRLGVAPSTAYRWLKGESEPDVTYWPQIEEALGLEEGTFFRVRRASVKAEYEAKRAKKQHKAQAQRSDKSRFHIDPDTIAASGILRDEDRPAMARLLEQILEAQVEIREQQAKIIKRLDLDEP